MGKILELPVHIANQIKAGEIVERPVSVVKELVENAIDAHSTQIDIIVEEGGLSKIQVIDNGEGIDETDVLVAFKRHATSKMTELIAHANILTPDKMPITTLGFRGEALSSIAAVSKVTLETARDNQIGTHVKIEGGEVVSHTVTAARKGTSVTVSQLFYNTPARLKFISSLQAEIAKIADLVNRLALSHPNIAFSLVVDNNQLLKTIGNGQLKQTIAGVYSPAIAKQMIDVQAENLRFSVSGYTSLPELTRAKKNFISIFLNGRYIRNFLLVNAVVDGYKSKLMIGRFPITVLNITVDHRLVDVNAHPTKETVRISEELDLVTLIKEAIAQAMDHNNRIPSSPPKRFLNSDSNSIPRYEKVDSHQEKINFISTDFVSKSSILENDLPFNGINENNTIIEPVYETAILPQQRDKNDTSDKMIRFDNDDENEQNGHFPILHYFGQMHGTYLFAENENGLYIVDQHAAQERIKYEYYRVEIGKVGIQQQQLLVPIVLEYPVNEYLLVKENLSVLQDVGIYLGDFGQNSFLLEAHPVWIKEDVETVVRELVQLAIDNKQVDIARYRENLAIMMSCKKSIKANHYLDDKQARQLLLDLSLCQNPYNCPHGRPVLIHLSNTDMEKMFKRIQDRG